MTSRYDVSELCPTCKKPFHYRRKRKLAGIQTNVIGRPKKRNDELIWSLRDKGFSYRSIAEKTGVSKGAVQASLKERK